MLDNQHPRKIFFSLLIFVFTAELCIMYLLNYLEGNSEKHWLESFSDATLLTALCIPFFWYFAMHPLRKALMALRAESVKLQKILETAAEGIISIDTAGRIQTFNRAAQRIFGYEEAEVIGKNITLLVPPSHRERHDDYLARYLQTGELEVIGKTVELQGMRKDGTIFPIEMMLAEVRLGEAHLLTAMLRDISEQKLSQQKIEHMAHYDALTGLPNRTLFLDRLNRSIISAKRNQQCIALLFMDLDGFKNVNDTLGHHFGDLLLVKVAERLNLSVRESDTLARLGGDEFTLILNDAHHHDDIVIVAEKILESINTPFNLDGHVVQIGISIGIARYPVDADTRAMLIVAADRAMYAAKSAGKNTYKFGVPVGEVTKSFPVPDSIM